MGKRTQDSSSESLEDQSNENQAQIEDDDQDEFAKLSTTADFKDFLRIVVATGNISEDDISSLTEITKARLVDKFQAWLAQGKPRPNMPATVEKAVEKIEKIYRIKSKGTQYMYYVIEGSPRAVGIDYKPVYAQITQADGTKLDDETRKIGEEKIPTIPYTEKEARALLDKAHRYTDNVGLYFVFGNVKIKVFNPENFFGDYDEMDQRAVQKRERI